jgi:hypothetical protein
VEHPAYSFEYTFKILSNNVTFISAPEGSKTEKLAHGLYLVSQAESFEIPRRAIRIYYKAQYMI